MITIIIIIIRIHDYALILCKWSVFLFFHLSFAFVVFSRTLVRTKPSRQLTTSQSDERIFEHPEVTIKPSALDDELQRRLVNLRTSNPTENVLEQDARQSAPNILEHPDMRTPVVMQSQQPSSSSSSSAILIHTDCKRVSRTQSGKPINSFLRCSCIVSLFPSWCLYGYTSYTLTR